MSPGTSIRATPSSRFASINYIFRGRVNLLVTSGRREAESRATARAMKFTKPQFADSEAEAAQDPNREERQLALEYLAEAWNTAEDDGIESYALAHASLFAALTSLVTSHGSE